MSFRICTCLDINSGKQSESGPTLVGNRSVEVSGLCVSSSGLRYPHDPDKLIKKKFKPAPTTQAEVRDCALSLDLPQLNLISCGPKAIDFGQIFVKSTITKSFSVFNDLPQCVLVTLGLDGIELLAKSTPLSQVVPSAHAAGFDLVCSSATPKDLNKTVVYTINGVHTNKILSHNYPVSWTT